ncbi:hypothetical protein FACS189472_10470 [Alphaproteobacteria bacterium]|nr:hypothetical protein FACS189472_10470 [Alphaproteobacteria bacterium]
MITNRRVRWNKEALEFFESADDESLVLDIIISYSCASQTDEGFEELVNSIESIKRKIKKVNITDTSCLYRHSIPEFSQYSDSSKQTKWFLNNKDSVSKLMVDYTMKSWTDGLRDVKFQQWIKQIRIDFAGDESGNNVEQEFRDAVLVAANEAVSKGSGTLKQCINFILEECAYTCAHFRNIIMVYPMDLGAPLMSVIRRYNLDIRILHYRTSNYEQTHRHVPNKNKINQEVISFMTEKARNVNFFVIDKEGNFIYKNDACNKVIEHSDAKRLPPKTWEITTSVMRTKEQIIAEEESTEGEYYLSVKAPLIIDDEIEGVIGLAVNITDRKKAQQLEMENAQQQARIEEQENFKIFTEQVVHDVRSPLTILSMLTKNCKGLSEKEHIALRNVAASIENIANNLLNVYKKRQKRDIEHAGNRFSERYISLYISLLEILNNKRYQYKDLDVKFNFSCDPLSNFAFISGDYSDFCRMISNLVNNSVEALEGRQGIIEVSFTAKNKKVEITIKDNGKGMPIEMVDKIMTNIQVDSTKESGYGIGMQQVKNTLQQMNGQMSVKSTESVGTEIILIFPESEPPAWVAGQIVLHKGEIVVILDDDPSIHSVWENRLKEYSNDITIKYFIQSSEAIDYINSSEQKDKILLLTDYELRNQGINGIDVIEKTNMQKQSVVVTSVYTYKIENFSEKTKFLKMVSKLYMNEIPIVMEEDRKAETADIVFIDDNKIFTQTLSDFFDNKGIKAHTYNSPDTFLKNLSTYSKNTRIVIDNELNSEIIGLELAKQLHEKGYINLYLFSGKRFNGSDVPPYLTVILKGNADFMERLL